MRVFRDQGICPFESRFAGQLDFVHSGEPGELKFSRDFKRTAQLWWFSFWRPQLRSTFVASNLRLYSQGNVTQARSGVGAF